MDLYANYSSATFLCRCRSVRSKNSEGWMQPFLNGERYLVRLYLLHQYDQVFTPIREMSSQRKIPELFFYFSSVCIKEATNSHVP